MSLLEDNADMLGNVIRADAYRARNLGINAVEDDPEKVAEAVRLEKLSGVPAPAIYGDLDEFKLTQKRRSTEDLLRQSPALQDYINSNPLAAKVSNDDLDRLDEAGSTLRQFHEYISPEKHLANAAKFAYGFLKGFDQNTGPDQFRENFGEMFSYVKPEDLTDENMLRTSVLMAVATVPEIAIRSLSGVFGTLQKGAVEGTREGLLQAGADEGTAARAARGVGEFTQFAMDQVSTKPHVVAPAKALFDSHMILAAERARPYIERGEAVPAGLHPILDQIKAEQAKYDIEKLEEAQRQAQASTTRERAPDFYESFVSQQTGLELGISAEAVRKLYGDTPLEGDGPLAFVPNLREQVELAETYGGDVVVPVAKWLAHTDPEVMKALRENVRVGRRGMTLEEAKAPELLPRDEPAVDAFETEVNAVRQLMQTGPAERKLALQRKLPRTAQELAEGRGEVWDELSPRERSRWEAMATNAKEFGEAGYHNFDMLDQEGKKVGFVDISELKGGEGLYIDMVGGAKGYGPADFGPRLMRDLIRQLAEAFPDAKWLEGERVTGARGAQGKSEVVRVPLKATTPIEQLEQFFKGWSEAEGKAPTDTTGMKDVGLGTKARDVDEAAATPEQTALITAVDDLLARITPRGVRVQPVDAMVTASGAEPRGLYTMYKDAEPVIRWAIDGPDALGTARHEAIHHLRRYGFLSQQEWGVLERAARSEGWLEKHGIDSRYPDAEQALKIEEAVAEEYKTWANDPARYKGPAATVFEKLKELMEWVAKTLRETFGKDVTADEVFAAIEQGFIGERKGTKPLDEQAFQTSQEGEKPPFATASAFGSTERNAQRYAQLIAKRNAEDYAKALKRAEAQERREQTAEWKQNYAAMRDEVEADLGRRPDIAVQSLLRDQMWFGERLDHPVKVDPETLPIDLREAFPKDLTAKDGMSADSLGQMLGYPDGRSLADGVIRSEIDRKVEGLSWARWKDRQFRRETDRRMAAAYGDLKENIAEAARDQALSETQMELLHEETMAMASAAGAEFSFTKDQIKRMARDHFEAQPAKGLKPETFLTAAGRAGRKVEDALLAGKPLDAFRAKQQQFIATLMAKEAGVWAKEQVKLDRLIKRLSPHHVESMETSYANYAQELLARAQVPIRRSMTDIQLGIAHEGHGSFGEFLAANFRDGGELYATPEMQQGLVKPYEQMTVAERRDFARTLESLWHEGRATQKLVVAGERYELEQVRGEIRDNIRQLPLLKAPNKLRDWAYAFDAQLTKPEEMLKDLDLRQEMGPLFKYVMIPMADAKAHEYTLLNELVAKLRSVSGDFSGPWMKTLDDTIPQTLLRDPEDGMPFDMKRENLIQVMLNWGTASSRKKFADGWGRTGKDKLTKEQSAAFEAQITQLINTHATAQDWAYVRRVWDIFADWKPLTDTVYRNLSGTAPKWIPNETFDTPHGPVEGKYFPIIYDPFYGNIDAKRAVSPSVGAFPADYYRSTTGNGYTIERTGYTDRVQFMVPLESVASRMQQTIHDIAFREAVINTNKLLYDKGIMNAVTRHYGKAYMDNLQAWVHRVANETNMNERELRGSYDVLRRFRLNLIGHTLPFNLKVWLSPDMGTANPKVVAKFLANHKENMAFVMENSKEVQHMVYNMDRDFREALTSTIGKAGLLEQTRRWAIEKGFKPATYLSQQFRAATWLGEYNAQRAKGTSHYDAAHLADSTVRERHGAASMVDLPSIMASSEAMKTFTMFYGYFNTMQNWMRQVPGNVRRGEWGKATSAMWGTVGIGALFGAALFNKQTEKDSWFKVISKAVGLQLVQGLPFARDAATYAVEGFSPRTAYASAAVATKALVDDVHKALSGKKIDKPVAHTANAAGLLTGLPLAQVGRTGEFAYDVATSQQHPRNILEWARGVITGEARLPKR